MDVGAMFAGLKQSAAPYGVEINPITSLVNSHLALLASEFAKDHGKFHDFHEAVFHACFTKGQDISKLDVLLALAEHVGLAPDEMRSALQDGRYEQRLEETQSEAARYGISGTPTFIINGRYKLVGARPLDSFRAALKQIAAESQSESER